MRGRRLKSIPQQVDVIGFSLSVERHSKAVIARTMKKGEPGKVYRGYLDPHTRIVISRELNLQEAWEVLLHEVGHEIQFVIADFGLRECDLALESTHTLYHRLLTGVLLTNGWIA